MLDLLRAAPAPTLDAALADALARAAGAFARLDQALGSHPLRPAFLHRVRLEAVRRQAAVDGKAIDPWHLAAVLEGLRLRMSEPFRVIDHGDIGERDDHADRRNAHKPPRRGIRLGALQKLAVQDTDLFAQALPACGFRGKAAGDSDAFQPLIPTQTSHRFRSKPATR